MSSSPQNQRLPSAIVDASSEHDEQERSNDEDADQNSSLNTKGKLLTLHHLHMVKI